MERLVLRDQLAATYRHVNVANSLPGSTARMNMHHDDRYRTENGQCKGNPADIFNTDRSEHTQPKHLKMTENEVQTCALRTAVK